jgi:hypothetical protein
MITGQRDIEYGLLTGTYLPVPVHHPETFLEESARRRCGLT